MDIDPQSQPDSPPRLGVEVLRTGLLIAASALFGGLAVVLWNRSSLSKLRQPPELTPSPDTEIDEEVADF